jgi:hypothetical protein
MGEQLIVPSFLHHHFGDILCIISEIERLHNEGNDVWIRDRNDEETNKRYLEYLSIYNLNWKYQTSNNLKINYKWREFTELYKNPPLLCAVYKHDNSKIYKKITYTRDANWMPDQKLNPEWNTLWDSIKTLQWIEVNKNTGGNLQCQKLIAESDLFIGVDNGVSHMAKSVGIPMILLEYKLGLERGFPSSIVQYTKATTNEEIINLIKKYYLTKSCFEI